MDETQALVPSGDTITTITISVARPRYDDSLAQRSQLADELTKGDVFAEYRRALAHNTLEAQRDTLQLFASFLLKAEVNRNAEELYRDPEAWRGITHGMLTLFRA